MGLRRRVSRHAEGKLPPELFELRNLRALKFNWTSLEMVPEEIRKLDELVFIELCETPTQSTWGRPKAVGRKLGPVGSALGAAFDATEGYTQTKGSTAQPATKPVITTETVASRLYPA